MVRSGHGLGRVRPGVLSAFRATLLGRRADVWAMWGTDAMRAEHDEMDRQIRAGAPLLLSADQVFGVLNALGDPRAPVFAWGGDGYGRDWTLTEADELTQADGTA